MAIRMTGLTSGLDTEAIVEALMSAQKMKTTKVKNKLTKSEWTGEIWKDMNKKLYSFYTTELTKFKTQGSYLTKKATSSKESVATATATNSAVTGSHSLAVESLASAQMITGAKISNAEKLTTSLTDLGMAEGTVIEINGVDGKSSKLEVTSTTTIADFVDSCKAAGLNASFDTAQKRLFVSSSKSGAENGFSITTGVSTRMQADKAINALFESVSDESLYDDYIAAADVIKGKLQAAVDAGKRDDLELAAIDVLECARGDAGADIPAVLAKYDITEEEYNNFANAFNAAKAKDDADKSLNNVMSDYLADRATADNVKGNFDTVAASRDDMLYTSELKSAYQKLQSLDEATYTNLKGMDLDTVTEADIEAAGLTREQVDAYSFLKENLGSQIDAFDAQMEIYIKNEVTTGAGGTSQLEKLGLMEIDSTGKTSNDNIVGTDGISIKWASDATVLLDGARLTGSSNTFTVNGLTLNLNSTTFNETTNKYDEISLTVNNDAKTAYDMVKNFVKKYNELLDEMNTKYSAKSAREYDPLTDEQKEAMTDDEVEKWEKKIKDSLLRRDDTLSGVISVMRSSLQVNVEIDGKRYSLASFGIKTSSDYTEKGKLHIFGDEEDDTYATENNALMEALEKDPEAVMKTLAQAGQNLYDAMTKKMSKTSISSALTFYNDKKMENEQNAYKKSIKEMEKKLTDLENKYYKQFTAMESALTKMQNSANSVLGFFGS